LPRSMILASAGACVCMCAGAPTSLILLPSISTAAGESTFPVRGSSRRLALTRVFEVGASATTRSAAKRRTAKTRKVRIPTRAPRFGKNRLGPVSSLITERDHRIHFHGAARGKITRKSCDTDEKESYTGKGQRICLSHAIKQTCHQVRNDQGANKSDRSAGNGEAQSLTQNNPENVRP